MDYQVLFNFAIVLAAFFGGWILNNIMSSVRKLDSDVRAMPENYVRKDDYRQDVRELKEMLSKLFDRLDGKVDKGAH